MNLAEKNLKVRMFEKRLLRRTFGPSRDETIRSWRKLHEGLHNVFSSPDVVKMIKSRRVRWEDHVARMGEKRNACSVLEGKLEGKRPLGRPRRR
jgi:hypothetical protein